jgi:predicted DNA-binding transcriptional regulator AlpA
MDILGHIISFQGPMPAKTARTGEPKLTSSEVARLLGISQRTLFRKLKDGSIPEPVRNPSNQYRQWRPDEIPQLKELLKERL